MSIIDIITKSIPDNIKICITDESILFLQENKIIKIKYDKNKYYTIKDIIEALKQGGFYEQ